MSSSEIGGFDLSSVEQIADTEDQPTPVHLHDIRDVPMYWRRDGKEHPVLWYICGEHSRRFRRAQDALNRRKLKSAPTYGSLNEDAIELIVACSDGWEGVHNAGKPVEFTRENARQVLKVASWIRDQLQEAMRDHSRFLSSGSRQP